MAKRRDRGKKIKLALSRMDIIVAVTIAASIILAVLLRSVVAIPFILLLLVATGAFVGERQAKSQAQSTTGQVNQRSTNLEQFVPLLSGWPWEKKRFTHVGGKHPFDGIQLTDDALLFIEIKTGKAANGSVSGDEALVRKHIREGRVGWRLVGLRDDGSLVIKDEKGILIPSG